MIQIPKDFREFIQLLNDNEVEYLVIGGYAVAYYGYVRYTCDIDFFVAVEKETALKMVSVFEQFGFRPYELTPELFMETGKVLRIGVEPMRLEILNEISGVDFKTCYKNREVLDADGLKLNLIGINELIKNKESTERSKDKLDAIELRKCLKRGRRGRRMNAER
jgi:predicted nucleotidyltransferase